MSELNLTLNERDLAVANKALSELETIDQRRVVSSALKDGSKVIIAQGKANLSSRNKVRKGNLSHSFGTQLKSRKKRIYSGFRRPGGAAAHLVDRGTKVRKTKSGANRGKVTGTMFWTDAVQSKGEQAVKVMMDKIIDEVNKIIDK